VDPLVGAAIDLSVPDSKVLTIPALTLMQDTTYIFYYWLSQPGGLFPDGPVQSHQITTNAFDPIFAISPTAIILDYCTHIGGTTVDIGSMINHNGFYTIEWFYVSVLPSAD